MPSIPAPMTLAGVLLAAALAPIQPAAAAPRAEVPLAADYAERVLGAVNTYRRARGLEPLLITPALTDLAGRHSHAMAERRRPSHDGFAQRFNATGAELCVENVAHGFHIPEQVLLGWQRVATHHRNVLEPRVRYVGVANQGLFVTFFACDTRE